MDMKEKLSLLWIFVMFKRNLVNWCSVLISHLALELTLNKLHRYSYTLSGSKNGARYIFVK